MKKLHISEELSLPIEFVTTTQAILAKRGVGKSYTASVEAEELLKAGQQVVVIDPTGAWFGLKSSADGKSAGFPIAVFGGEHADVPLEEHAGEVIAQAIVERRFSAILDLSLFRKGQVNRFMWPFLETLYRMNREAMHLIVDEADAIAPQKPFGEEARMLGAMEDVVRRGRRRGIGCTLITQRPQVLNKNVLTQCEIVCCMRMIHPKDIDALKDWVNVHGDPDRAKQMIASLPSLPVGTAWFWAPGFGDIFRQVHIRERETFDSSATPKAGQTQRTPKVLAPVDIEQLGQQIQSTVQRAKDNDPTQLKRRIADLEKKLASRPTEAKQVVEEKLVEVPAFTPIDLTSLNLFREAAGELAQSLAGLAHDLKSSMAIIEQAVKRTQQRPTLPTARRPERKSIQSSSPRRSAAVIATQSNGDLSGPQIRILSRLVELMECTGQQMVKKEQLAAWAEYSPNSGGFNNYLGNLRSAGLIEYPSGGYVAITDAGRGHAQPDEIPVSDGEMLERAKRVLGGSEARLLDVLHSTREPISKTELAEATDFSPNSGGFNNYLGHMRTLGFVEYPIPGHVKASDWLYIEGAA